MPLNAAGSAIIAYNEFLNTFGRLRSICVLPQGQVYVGTSNRDERGAPAETDDRIPVLENRAYMPSATRNAATFSFELFPNPAWQQTTLRLPAPGPTSRYATCWAAAFASRRCPVPPPPPI